MIEKDYNYTGYNQKLTNNSRELRKNMTRQEKHLWYDFLKNYPVKFYRQRPIDNFIADFYCSSAKLIIELDGGQHYTDVIHEYDMARTAILESYDIEVLRFPNSEIDKNFVGVCRLIDEKVKFRLDNKM